MNKRKAKRVRAACVHIANNYTDEVKRACQDKLNMANHHGGAQHRIINPRRQIKKMVMREALV